MYMYVLIICEFYKDPIKTKGAFLETRSNMGFFSTPRQAIFRQLVKSGQISISSEILCMSWLSHNSPTEKKRSCYPADNVK